MKNIFITLFLFISGIDYAQCDSMDYVLQGEFTTTSFTNPRVKLTIGGWVPPIGKIVEVSKKFETTIFGAKTTGWIGIATAKVVIEQDDILVLKIIEEKSEMVINGKKKNHFEKGNEIKMEWRGKAQTEPYYDIQGTDTLIIGQYKCGERSGHWRWFYPNKRIKNIVHYKNGIYHGEYEIYKEEGYLFEKGEYIDGRLNGVVTYYYESGMKKKTVPYKDGEKEGTATAYYESGQVKYTEQFKEDKVCCDAKDYFENGKIKIVATYNENGKFDGEFKVYRENGNLKFIRTYDNGDKTGPYKGTFY